MKLALDDVPEGISSTSVLLRRARSCCWVSFGLGQTGGRERVQIGASALQHPHEDDLDD